MRKERVHKVGLWVIPGGKFLCRHPKSTEFYSGKRRNKSTVVWILLGLNPQEGLISRSTLRDLETAKARNLQPEGSREGAFRSFRRVRSRLKIKSVREIACVKGEGLSVIKKNIKVE